MALLKPTRGAQYPLIKEFVFNFNDTIVDVNGVTKDFGTTIASAPVAKIMTLPVGAVVCGGELIVEVAGVGPTAYTVALGTSANAASLLAASSLLAAADTRYAILLTKQLDTNAGLDVQLTMVDSVAAATAGKFRVRIMYTIDNRANEMSAT